MKFSLCGVTLAICATALTTSLQLQAGTVTNTADSGDGSLRTVLATAENGETIDFHPTLNGATITLTSAELSIDGKQFTIDASSLPSRIKISGNKSSRIFLIQGNANISLNSIDLLNGDTSEVGGGIRLIESNLQMFDCVVTGCSASFDGGGINLAIGATATLERCLIVGNSSDKGFGGGIFIGGATATTIRNCVITGNSSPFGGGLALQFNSLAIVNCTIEGNTGGGIYCVSNSSPQIINSICWDNGGTTAAKQLKSSNDSLPVVSHSLIQGAASAASFGAGNPVTWGPGNLNGTLSENNPKFVAPDADLRLLAASPALDVGNNLAEPGSLDAAGASRIQNSTVDLGAYEGGFTTFAALHPSLDPAGDGNHNGISNLQEYGMGFDPAAAADPTAQPALSMDGADLLLTVNQRPNTLDLSPLTQTSTTLDNSWSALIEDVHYSVSTSTPVNRDRTRWVFRLIKTDPERFYRQAFTILP
ncbi:MAG: right-handed parallel beta-helix repeat-containing protein [Akkermansiaceae bacterium]